MDADEHMSDVQATYYSFLGNQEDLHINVCPVVPKKKKPQATSQMFAAAPGEGEDEKEYQGPVTGSEHLIGHLMKHILGTKIGVLPYEVQTDIQHYNLKE